ncbi:F-box and leucine-rich repeat protein 4 [Coemansia linderi]|uniref:F-box and leucine-rich repeat protein 4 n=1 Tax=Coemansia linderi TaxID=2663919 RepID=A0ACC1KHB3_9FUNG|nr:F-box and leucine-rich repeat protein 4 [Coemansia linderi]
MYLVSGHLAKRDLAQLCLVCKHAWQLVAPFMWDTPSLRTVSQLQLLSRSVGVALPLAVDDCKCYGDLLFSLDLSGVADRWDTVDYDTLAPIFKYCPRLQELNMSGCQKLTDAQFEQLFTYNAPLCSSLVSVDFSDTYFLASSVSRVVELLPGVIGLKLNVTTTDDDVLVAISRYMPDLERLEIERCGVSDIGIQALDEGCPDLVYLHTEMCGGITDTALVQQINDREEQEEFDMATYIACHRAFYGDHDSDDDYDDYSDYDDYDGDFYEFNYDKDDPDYYEKIERDCRRYY